MIDVSNKKDGDKFWFVYSDYKLSLNPVEVIFKSIEPNTGNSIIIVDTFDGKKAFRISIDSAFETFVESKLFSAIRLLKKIDLLEEYEKKKYSIMIKEAKRYVAFVSRTDPDLVVRMMMH